MNNTLFVRDFDVNLLRLTYVSGYICFLENIVLLVFIVQRLKTLGLSKENSDLIIQVFFVCINDTLSSFVLIWMGLVRVTGHATAQICVFSVILGRTLQTVSQCNITCISIFRFIVAKNIRKVGAGRQIRSTIILTVVNVAVLIVSLTSIFPTLKLRQIPESADMACEIFAIISSDSTFVITGIFFAIGVTCTIVADIVCVMTIFRLRREMNVIGHLEVTNSANDSSEVTRGGTALVSVRSRQHRAIFTLFLILVFFNLSILPLVLLRLITYFGFQSNQLIRRLAFILLFLNSMFNPIIIASRVHEIKRLFQKIFDTIKMRFTACLLRWCRWYLRLLKEK